MGRLLLSILILFISCQESFGQESKKYLKFKNKLNYYQGTVITKDSTKIEGLIKSPALNESLIYSEINFVNKAGSKIRYYPADLISFKLLASEYVTIDSKFYKVEQLGKMAKLYSRITSSSFSAPGGPNGMPMTYGSTSESNFVQLGDGELIEVRKRRFVEVFSELFADCPKVKSKIISKEWTHRDIRTIVSRYNYCN